MPDVVNRGVPEAIPLQEVLKAGPLPFCNGTAEPEGAEGDSSSHDGVSCRECGGISKSARLCSGCWQAWYCSKAHQVKAWTKHKRDCKPWKIICSGSIGKFMIATRNIAAGELLLQDPPLIIGPKQITEPVCLACYRPVDGSYCCSDCGFPMCDEQCQDAEAHLPECTAVKNSGISVKVTLFGETNSMYECIAPVRLLSLQETDTSTWNKILSLESHFEKRGNTEVHEITQRTVVDIIHLRLCLGQYSDDLIHRVLGVIDTNAFEIRLPDSSIMGVYSEGSMLEHSCVPNTHRTFDGDLNLVVRSAIAIKRGEHLSSCYTDSLSTTSIRQEHLLTSKFFICKCDRCIDPTEMGTFISAMLCPSCTKNEKSTSSGSEKKEGGSSALVGGSRPKTIGVAVPKDPISPSSPWFCMTCSAPLDSDYVIRITAVAAEEAEELEVGSSTISECEAFIEKWSSTFHSNHSFILNVKYALLNLYGSQDGYEYDTLSPLHLLRKEELSRQVLKVADSVVPGISRLRGSVLYELYQSLFCKTKSMFKAGVLSPEMARKIAQEAYDVLLECARVLSYEPPVQPEGQLGIEAKDELKKMQKWIREEGWKKS